MTEVPPTSEFGITLREIIRLHRPEKIVETGTHLGTGTTKIIADAIEAYYIKAARFFSIECNPEFYRAASRNLSGRGVVLLNQLSVPRSRLPTLDQINAQLAVAFANDVPADYPGDPRAAEVYLAESAHAVPDDALGEVFAIFEGCPDLVLLDSAGHMGKVEFDYVMELLRGRYIIALDDTNHLKHEASARAIMDDRRFYVVATGRERNGWLIASYEP